MCAKGCACGRRSVDATSVSWRVIEVLNSISLNFLLYYSAVYTVYIDVKMKDLFPHRVESSSETRIAKTSSEPRITKEQLRTRNS
jgi:hypothetical protein